MGTLCELSMNQQVNESMTSRDQKDLFSELEKVIESLHSIMAQISNSDSQDLLGGIADKNTFLQQINAGLQEAELMMRMCEVIEFMQATKQSLVLHNRRQTQENVWLREELNRTQLHLRQCQEKISTLEVEKEHLLFMQNLRERYDASLPPGMVGGEANQPNPASSTGAGGSGLPTSLSQEFLQIDNKSGTNRTPGGLSNSPSLSGIATSQSQSLVSVNSSSNYEIPSRLRVLHNLVTKYANEGRYEVAVPLCNQALDDLKRDCGTDSPDVATMQNILALVYRDQGKLNEAIALLNEALCIREKALGVDDPVVAATLNNLAVLYGKLGRFKEAEPLCKRSLKIREKVLGPNHIDVAKQLSNLALLCQNLGRYDEVEAYYQRALSIYRKESGGHDVNVAKTINNLASAYLKQNKLSEAEALFRTVIHSVCMQHGANNQPTPLTSEPDGPNSTSNAPPVSAKQVTLAAELLCRQCPKPELQTLLTSIQNLTIVLRKQSKGAAAEHMEKWSHAIISTYTAMSGCRGGMLMEESTFNALDSLLGGGGGAATNAIGNMPNDASAGSAANRSTSSLRRFGGKIAAKLWPSSANTTSNVNGSSSSLQQQMYTHDFTTSARQGSAPSRTKSTPNPLQWETPGRDPLGLDSNDSATTVVAVDRDNNICDSANFISSDTAAATTAAAAVTVPPNPSATSPSHLSSTLPSYPQNVEDSFEYA